MAGGWEEEEVLMVGDIQVGVESVDTACVGGEKVGDLGGASSVLENGGRLGSVENGETGAAGGSGAAVGGGGEARTGSAVGFSTMPL